MGISSDDGRITAFLVDLQYATDPVRRDFTQIARFDHNDTSAQGHDVRREGLRLDIERQTGGTVRLWPAKAPVPRNLGMVIRSCQEYLDENADFLVDVYEGRRRPETVPPWESG